MKRFSFVIAFMAFALFALSQSNYVYVEEAGTLDSLLNAFSLKDATQLTVEGKLNGSDIKTIRYMLGGRYLASQEEHGGKLESLDLTDATIVAGGEAYLFMETSSKLEARLFTSNDTVGEMMFWDCVNLKEIKLPLNITVIDGGAFQECVSLKSISIPEGITTINHGMLWGCNSLESVNLPSTLTHVYNYIIEECPNLNTLRCLASEPPICETNSFNSVERIILYVPEGCKEKYKMSAGWNVFATIIEENQSSIKTYQSQSESIKTYMIFDLSGKQIQGSPDKGIYIQNGRKFINK